jgi:multisubunit Na+/H+ antiporter MnhE subunit
MELLEAALDLRNRAHCSFCSNRASALRKRRNDFRIILAVVLAVLMVIEVMEAASEVSAGELAQRAPSCDL